DYHCQSYDSNLNVLF
nr:immunoglobulin light chain junction region [Macaca mulatta]MOW71138.1 immunoglobulin light chain junction region [Macaca mulatta]MOW72747.1 immunoglobulin light chain junction region [Macaca mulatta]